MLGVSKGARPQGNLECDPGLLRGTQSVPWYPLWGISVGGGLRGGNRKGTVTELWLACPVVGLPGSCIVLVSWTKLPPRERGPHTALVITASLTKAIAWPDFPFLQQPWKTVEPHEARPVRGTKVPTSAGSLFLVLSIPDGCSLCASDLKAWLKGACS